jgi:hypothetical protein
LDQSNKRNLKIIIPHEAWLIHRTTYGTLKIDAKIMHKGRGKFKIVEDKHKGNKIVDASHVIQCIVKSDENVHDIVSKV